ncbi:hypothetical protein I7F13_05105 [Sinorhizobium meliloti]|uniref:hypothetical protein n=1 Tax=Rhizobium meliloti TaxID=382 RepID=UPI000FD9BC5A|nr:hypothetical protein [Sinorhizobium meliloti]MDE3821809.1 hypothetical protein [Sinorhizobium meliloti]RVM47230.1 hypothetical protein CN127_18965 [Sinorhizobium meliloti]RVN75558.1 hypothetical protein CN106_00950 [Sinorhizobium meliloti]
MAFRDTWKRMNWLAVAGVATALYVIAVGYTLGWSRTWSFLTTEPDLNEVGDFLAGLLAPLALVWLIAAVLTQRQELNETRDQFIENQKVVDAQLKTINAQNALLSLQHNQSVENAKQAYRLNLFDKRYQIYDKFIKFGELHERKDYDEASYLAMVNLSQEAAFVFDNSIEEWLDEIAQQIFDYNQFKSGNPLKIDHDGYGNSKVADEDRNRQRQRQYGEFTDWIKEQFLPSERNERFWHFMHVSDKAYGHG